jgi:coenzyme Q-binding protein COQ10
MRTLSTTLHISSRPLPGLCLRCPSASYSGGLGPPEFKQYRSFLKPSSLDGLLGKSTPLRQLTHTRVLPYPRSSVFDAIASVDRYPSFLPFVTSAKVSERDQDDRPTRASLKVGYDKLGIEENWDSIVNAEEDDGIIEAISADPEKGDGDGVFEVLKTKWQLRDIEDIRRQGTGIGAQTAVRLDVEVKFRSALYDKIFAGVEEKVAGIMVGAFEKRIKELAGS